jgi:hypothetical protein
MKRTERDGGEDNGTPEELHDRSDKYVGCLTARVPSGDRISFFELSRFKRGAEETRDPS